MIHVLGSDCRQVRIGCRPGMPAQGSREVPDRAVCGPLCALAALSRRGPERRVFFRPGYPPVVDSGPAVPGVARTRIWRVAPREKISTNVPTSVSRKGHARDLA
jgi:hypothetical protein